MIKKLLPLVIISILLLSGCSKNSVPVKPADNTTTLTESNLTTYTNTQYNIEVTYPKDWIFEAKILDQTDPNSGLDIHINNPVQLEGNLCVGENGYVGTEIIASIDKTEVTQVTESDFRKFAKKYFACSDPLGGLGCLGGKIEDVTINGLTGIKGEDSGWDGCSGRPGYVLEQNSDKYMQIFTGADKGASVDDLAKTEAIVNSIKTLE